MRYSVGLHLQNGAGQLVAQADFNFPAETEACRTVELSLSGVAPGVYDLLATVYAWETGERLPPSSDFPSGDDRVLLGTITIAH